MNTPTCPSCVEPQYGHIGFLSLCQKLQEANKTIERLKAAAVEAKLPQGIDSMRSAIITCHGMASEKHVQSDAELLCRIAKCLKKTIMDDPAMRGFLGYGGPEADLDVLGNPATNAVKGKS